MQSAIDFKIKTISSNLRRIEDSVGCDAVNKNAWSSVTAGLKIKKTLHQISTEDLADKDVMAHKSFDSLLLQYQDISQCFIVEWPKNVAIAANYWLKKNYIEGREIDTVFEYIDYYDHETASDDEMRAEKLAAMVWQSVTKRKFEVYSPVVPLSQVVTWFPDAPSSFSGVSTEAKNERAKLKRYSLLFPRLQYEYSFCSDCLSLLSPPIDLPWNPPVHPELESIKFGFYNHKKIMEQKLVKIVQNAVDYVLGTSDLSLTNPKDVMTHFFACLRGFKADVEAKNKEIERRKTQLAVFSKSRSALMLQIYKLDKDYPERVLLLKGIYEDLYRNQMRYVYGQITAEEFRQNSLEIIESPTLMPLKEGRGTISFIRWIDNFAKILDAWWDKFHGQAVGTTQCCYNFFHIKTTNEKIIDDLRLNIGQVELSC